MPGSSIVELRKLRLSLYTKYFIHFPTSTKNTVLLSSVGSSGSTWIASLLNFSNDYREIFEPFLPIRIPEANAFEYCAYLSPSESDSLRVGAARKILEGRLRRCAWLDDGNRKFISHKRLIKDIRTNLMLGWMSKCFPETKLILLIRNPFTVVQSFMKLGWGVEPCGNRREIDIILQQHDLINDYPEIDAYSNQIDLTNPFEYLMLQWCILNYIPLKQRMGAEFHTTFYENYLLEPEKELRSLYQYVGIKMDKNVLDALDKPSRTAYKRRDFTIALNLPRGHIDRGLEILNMFGLDNLYDENLLPNSLP